MSKYVTKKHGLVVGSGNTFFYHDDRDGLYTYPAIVRVQRYNFDKFSEYNFDIETPAQQMIFYHRPCTEFIDLSPAIGNWLKSNAPGFGFDSKTEKRDAVIYFVKRQHALDFCKMVDDQFAGMSFAS